MTREEARASIKKHLDLMYPYNTPKDVLKVTYEALEQPQVIRCKDCKYCEACDDEEHAEPLIFDGLIWCNIHEFSRKPDYFCGDAERKDGDGNVRNV